MRVRRVRRRVVRATRHTFRNVSRWRPTPVGALLIGAVLVVGASGVVAAVGPDEAHGDRGVIMQQFDPGAGHEHLGHGPGGDHHG